MKLNKGIRNQSYWNRSYRNNYKDEVNERENQDFLLAQWWKQKEKPAAPVKSRRKKW